MALRHDNAKKNKNLFLFDEKVEVIGFDTFA
jgi:hypothetical protein